mmetsp:Transcript_12902/g.24147  ORF Transcript_12902/g.24147 Transcript_12902/m.24147 type:complete len:118 (-) Transcript_12902:1011-1364(-)
MGAEGVCCEDALVTLQGVSITRAFLALPERGSSTADGKLAEEELPWLRQSDSRGRARPVSLLWACRVPLLFAEVREEPGMHCAGLRSLYSPKTRGGSICIPLCSFCWKRRWSDSQIA